MKLPHFLLTALLAVLPAQAVHAAAPDWPGVSPLLAEAIQKRSEAIAKALGKQLKLTAEKQKCVEAVVQVSTYRLASSLDAMRPGGGYAFVHAAEGDGPHSFEQVDRRVTGKQRQIDTAKAEGPGGAMEKLRANYREACKNDGGGGPGTGSGIWSEWKAKDENRNWDKDPQYGPPLFPDYVGVAKALPQTVQRSDVRAFVAKAYPEFLSELDEAAIRVAKGEATASDIERLRAAFGLWGLSLSSKVKAFLSRPTGVFFMIDPSLLPDPTQKGDPRQGM